MTSKIVSALCTLALFVPGGKILRAADLTSGQPTGHVLVLDNERTLEGDVERQGTQYRLRRSAGELWIPSEKVLRLCATREEAYTFLRSRANLLDPDEHLRLARWCQFQGLRKQALDEVRAAVELRPDNSESRRLLRCLQPAAVKPLATQPAQVPDEAENSQAVPEVNTQSLSLFITKVQPILMNACASCHATGRGGAFRLVRIYDNTQATRKTTQQNLAAVLAAMNKEHPQGNLVLVKAISVHGDMAQPVFKSKDVPAYRTLEEWIRLTSLPGSSTREPVSVAANTPPAGESPRSSDHPVPKEPVAAEAQEATQSSSKPIQSTFHADEQAQAPGAQAVEGAPLDPYDPAIFNGQTKGQHKGKKWKH